MPFDLDAFIAGVAKDCTKEKSTGDRIKKVLMNLKNNQGTVTILPFISKKVGNIYLKLTGVREVFGATSVIDAPDGAWYKILPKKMYGELTEKQSELYDEVAGLYQEVIGYDYFSYDTLRQRTYSLFTGICLSHVNTDNIKLTDNLNEPCLFVFPSNSPIDALNTAISNKSQVLKDRMITWIQGIITPSNTGRKGALVVTFKKSDSPGYTSSVSFETNNLDEGIVVVDPKQEFTDEVVSKFDDPLRTFLGWNYDYDNESYFNETVFIELRDVLKLYLKEILSSDEPQETQETKVEMPPVPGDDKLNESTKPVNRPF